MSRVRRTRKALDGIAPWFRSSDLRRCKQRGPEFSPPREEGQERELLAAVVNGWNRAARSIGERNSATKLTVAKPLKQGDVFQWYSTSVKVQGRIHAIEEKDNGVKTIRMEPVGSQSRTLNADDKVEVLLT